MPIKSIEKETFTYLVYKRESLHDYMEFKDELDRFVKTKDSKKDVVVDFTKSDSITEGEAGLLANVLKKFMGTKRTLRLIVTKPIQEKLNSQNLFMSDNLMIFNSHKLFLEFLEKPKEA